MDHEYEAVFRMGRLRSHFFSSGEGGGGGKDSKNKGGKGKGVSRVSLLPLLGGEMKDPVNQAAFRKVGSPEPL